MNSDSPLLRASGLHKSYVDGEIERCVLRDVALEANPGEVIVLWGPSGSGKSTLLNLLAGVQAADAGNICLRVDAEIEIEYGCSSLLATQALRRQHIGYVFQFFNLVPTLTVQENIELSLQLAYGTAASDHRAAAMQRARDLGLDPHMGAFPNRLSGGEAQRAAIARAMAHNPRLLLADEPTGNLDAANAAQVMGGFFEQLEALDSALVLATHDEGIAARAHRVLDLT